MNANFIKRMFYVPNYLSLPVAGIEICNNSIKYIELSNNSGSFSVKNFGDAMLPQNVMRDGSILNKNALVKTLSEVKKNISADFVKVSIAEEKTYIFDVQLPKEAATNMREALEFKIEENVPLKLEESSFEYEIVEEKKASNEIVVNVSVIPKKVIADYTEVLNLAGIYPQAFEIESKMIASSVIPKKDKRDAIIMKIKDDSTLFIAVIDGYVRVTSSISVGENLIKDNLLKSGMFQDEHAICKFFENDFSFEAAYEKDSYSSLVNIFSILKDEIEKFNKYVSNKFPDMKTSAVKDVEKIVLCGKCSTLPGLSKHVNQNIKAGVILANAWSNLLDTREQVPTIKFSDSLGFVTPIGLVVSSNVETNA